MLKRVNGNGTLEPFCGLQCRRNCSASDERRVWTAEGSALAYLPGQPQRATVYYAVVRLEAYVNSRRLCAGKPVWLTTTGHGLLCGGSIGGSSGIPRVLFWSHCPVDNRGAGLHSRHHREERSSLGARPGVNHYCANATADRDLGGLTVQAQRSGGGSPFHIMRTNSGLQSRDILYSAVYNEPVTWLLILYGWRGGWISLKYS